MYMPRALRLTPSDHVFHVVNRGNNRQLLFDCPYAYEEYWRLLLKYKRLFHILIHHYVLMPNHVHLVLQPTKKANDVSQFMRRLTLSHTRRINNRLKRSGHLWQGRFFSTPITQDAYLLACGAYVELNPVKAGLVVHPQEYPWSSFGFYAGIVADALVDQHVIMTALGTNPATSRREYLRLIDEKMAMLRAEMRT